LPKGNQVDTVSLSQRPATADRPSLPCIQAHSSDTTAGTLSGSPLQQLPSGSGSDDFMDLVFSTSDMDSCSTDLTMQRSLEFLFPGLSHDAPQTVSSVEQASHGSNRSPNGVGDSTQLLHEDLSSDTWNMGGCWENYLKPLPTPPHFNISSNESPVFSETSRHFEDEAERIAALFCQQTCHTLSIEDETGPNPWRTLIWPLTTDHPVVYHAVAALTCYSMCKQQAQLQLEGARHARQSLRTLGKVDANGDGMLIAALAANIALGFAESWDYKESATGLDHIRGGTILLQQLLSNRGNIVPVSEEEDRLDFLAHTWTYMDVLARFTCDDLSLPPSANISVINLNSFGRDPSRLDPLMGYSTTLFPIMRRVANLINRVRARETSRNSPAIISNALELRREIEHWTPPIDLEITDDPSQTMIDAIQTAEAYRWSTLLILYQAVPELPNLTSYGELAQKILVYLATIPLSSTTIIVHMFPLMIAGCDAVEEEDRDFVRERWDAMSKRMVTGSVDRCLKIIEEVWKRREEYLRTRGLSFTSNGLRVTAAPAESTALSEEIATFIGFDNSPGANTMSSGGSAASFRERLVRKGNDFPISAAFKKGVDMLTRSGCTEYTVRGRLHWLGVMKDWNWQCEFVPS
jgi:hypothetical protein